MIDDGVASVPQLVLTGPFTRPSVLARDVWAARELCLTLARKEFFVRYRRAAFGILWAVVVPVLQALVMAHVLSKVTKFSVPHYTVFVFSGIVAWSYFSATAGGAATAIVDNSALSSKIYFPRAVLPIATALSNLFTLAVSSIILLIAVAASRLDVTWRFALLLPASALCLVQTTLLALVLGAVHVYMRDVKYAVQAALLVLFYLTPVFYPLSRLHGVLLAIVVANPLTGVVQLFHWALAPTPNVGLPLVVSIGWTALFGVLAMVLHCRLDRSFADML